MNLFMRYMLLFPDPAPAGGGPAPAPAAPAPAPAAGNVTLTKEQFDALMARLPGAPAPAPAPAPADPDDLAKKAQLKREEDEKKSATSKRMEKAVKFSVAAAEWLKTNASLLPKTIEGIFAQAEKEVYTDAVEKDSAIKAGLILEFFAVQANLDLLTEYQKTALEEFRLLTKTVKQERAQSIYEQIFEPAFETLKKVKRAEEISKGHSPQSGGEKDYLEKLMKNSRKHYLGEKQ